MNKKDGTHFVKNIIGDVKTSREPLVKHHVEPNVKESAPTSGKSQEETTELTMNIFGNDLLIEIKEVMSEVPQIKQAYLYIKRIKVKNEDDDNPLVNPFHKIVEEKAAP